MTTPAVPAPAPAAPAAPVPAPAPALEPVAPPHEGIHAAKDKAAEFLANLGKQPPAPPVEPPAPRREDGTFAPKVEPEGAPPVGVNGEAAPAADPSAAEPAGGAPPAPAGEGEFVEVSFPGRRPGEETVLAFPKEAEEEAKRLSNKVRAVEKLEAERGVVAREAQMVRETQFIIQNDPIGFVMEQFNPTLKPDIVRQLLADPQVLAEVAADLELALDPSTRENFQLRQQAKRADLREQTRTQLAETRRGQQNAHELRENVLRLVPETWNPEQVSTFMRDALLDLGQYAATARVNRIEPSNIPVILAQRLRAVGLDPVLAATRLLEGAAASGTPSGGNRPPASPAPNAPRVTVKALAAQAAATAALATTPPAGPGSLPAGSPVKPPAGSSLKDARKHALASIGRPA